jgi:uncharacterized protein
MQASRTLKQLQHVVMNINFNTGSIMHSIATEIFLNKTEVRQQEIDLTPLPSAIQVGWQKIAPFWPLKNLIAVNPLAGFEDLPFEDALQVAASFFQQKDMPEKMQDVNRESIKWLQVFFDQGQSTISMPLRHKGLLKSVVKLLPFDKRLKTSNVQNHKWLRSLSDDATLLIRECLSYLDISKDDWEIFLTLMLTTLPGWAAHIQYCTSWCDTADKKQLQPVTKEEYLAFRLVVASLVWPQAKELLCWNKNARKQINTKHLFEKICNEESVYINNLLNKIEKQRDLPRHSTVQAQFVFCIDVRSEPFRRSLEAQGEYETFGFAGFFGVPVAVENGVTGECYASCPVLLKPAFTVVEKAVSATRNCDTGYKRLQMIKKLYQSVKYNFTTPIALVETLGGFSGLWMAIKSLSPKLAATIKTKLQRVVLSPNSLQPSIDSIAFSQQVAYAQGALTMMGMTGNFAPVVVFCSHGSATENNAFATALDCGACGGHHGAANARILADIANRPEVRQALRKANILIPQDTHFIAAKHNTTTDEVEFFDQTVPKNFRQKVAAIKEDLKIAQVANCARRSEEMGIQTKLERAVHQMTMRSLDWAQVRPEWGLARNASFIVGPRWLTKNVDLEGRSFLHSYEWEQDSSCASLRTTSLTLQVRECRLMQDFGSE